MAARQMMALQNRVPVAREVPSATGGTIEGTTHQVVDVLSPEQRRRNMQAVRNSETKGEIRLRAALRNRGLTGYRKNASTVVGRPDVAYTRWRVAIFLDGCFWHGCPACYVSPKSNEAFWQTKLAQNQARDTVVTTALREAGWTVLRLWEHEVRGSLEKCVERIAGALADAGRPDT